MSPTGLRKSCLFIPNGSLASRWGEEGSRWGEEGSRSGEEGAGGGLCPPPAPSSPVSAFGASSQRVQRLLRSLDESKSMGCFLTHMWYAKEPPYAFSKQQ